MNERDQLEQRLREIITGCEKADGSCVDCHCTGNATVYLCMAAVDSYTFALGVVPQEIELWNATRVAEYTGQSSRAAARSWLSRAGVKSHGHHPNPDTGRDEAVYPANQVRAAMFQKATS